MGRPRKSTNRRDSQLGPLRLSEAEIQIVKDRAKKRGLTLAEYRRRRLIYDVDVNIPRGLPSSPEMEP